ncbi:MAG: glycosyltransferase family 2 protein [Coriobacteriia bacterium]|nr:glycosyltransferase family 2 protein [Coriobacteriia bacterium]
MRSGVVVLPVYNEAPTVLRVLDAVRAVFDGPVVVVDDGSDDGTADLLAERDDIQIVTHPANAGYGASLIDGFAAALATGSDAVVTMDCDGQHEPAHIPEFLFALDECAIVSGSRYLPGSRAVGEAPAERQDVNRRVTEIINGATGWSITDAFCGFKSYRAEALAQLSLTEPGYAMPLELWARAYRTGLCVVEHPVERIYFDGDRSFGQDLDDPDRRFRYYLRVWERALS